MEKQLTIFDVLNEPFYLIHTELFPDTESDEIEYKSAKDGFPFDFWKTYSAFANTNGGIIVLGIKEKKNQFIVEGLTDKQIVKYQKDFWSGANNPKTVSVNLLKNDDVKEFVYKGIKVLVFSIPSADRKHKPVHLTPNPFKNTYKRNYEGDYCCTDEEVRRMLADADLSYIPDSRILEGYSFDDIDMSSLKQYRQIFASVRPSHTWLSLDDKGFLEQLGGYRKDRKTKREGFTVAGLLMFGKYLSITDEECCPKFFPDYREKLSENEEIRWTDRIYPDGTWEGNLFQFYRLVYPKLSSRLPKPFQLSKGQRQEDSPAHTALREAFVNALIHTDYSAPGSIVIESTPTSFVFTNPGTLLVTMSQFYRGGISECRNVSLQKMFLMIGSAEKAGSGVSKILSGWSFAHWRHPYLSLETEPDRVILEMPMFSIIPEDTLSDLKAIFGDSVEALGKDELTALAVCHIEGEISNTRLQYIIDRHKSDITKLLQELCKDGYLVPESKNRWTIYRLNNPNVDSSDSEDSSNVDSSGNVDSSYVTNATGNLGSSSVDSSDSEDSSNVDSSDNEDSSNEDGSDGKRYKYEELAEEIIQFCKIEYKSSFEIADALNKSEKYLKNRILPRMIKEEKLFKLHSDNHPNQKYTAKK
jgi:predicted HTH transcriptional regulator